MLFNDFRQTYQESRQEINDAIKRVLESGWFILGDEVKKFENNFSAFVGSKHAIGVGNGLESLQIALMAVGIGKGDEVITTSHSAVATALSIVAVGATPVFADIDQYFHLDSADIAQKITPRTKAIIPVHLYGQSVDIDAILDLARKHDLVVIEDCAQAHGATWQGQRVGTFGSFGCFSFYPTKNLGAFGDAGALVTNDDYLAELAKMERNYGQKNRYEHEIYGINSRLDEMQAAILSVLLTKLDNNNTKRKTLATLYRENLSTVSEVSLPLLRKNSDLVYHLFVIRAKRRDDLMKFLNSNGIPSLIHYPLPIHKQKCFSDYNHLTLPNTEAAAEEILSLPIHPYLTPDEVRTVCDKIKEFYAQK